MKRKDNFASEAARAEWLALERRVGIETNTPGLEPPNDADRVKALRALELQQEIEMRSYGKKAAPWIEPTDPGYFDKLHGLISDRGGQNDPAFRRTFGE